MVLIQTLCCTFDSVLLVVTRLLGCVSSTNEASSKSRGISTYIAGVSVEDSMIKLQYGTSSVGVVVKISSSVPVS